MQAGNDKSSGNYAKQRQEKRKLAVNWLQQPAGKPEALYELAAELRKLNEFGYARRLLERARAQPIADPELSRKCFQLHALSTYKDPDLPTYGKLKQALKILDEADNLRSTRDQETLGLAGAIHKRFWHLDGNKQHLEQSQIYYQRGLNEGVTKDYGYTGINAAYVLDLLANLEDKQAEETGNTASRAEGLKKQARAIRTAIIDSVPPLAESPEGAWLGKEWWFFATIAEAHLGLSNWQAASLELQKGRKLDNVAPWEFESTAVQLASLVQVLYPREGEGASTVNSIRASAWKVIEELLDGRGDAVTSVFAGKLGLALSGGGFRASFFHIGVLAKLAELDLLRHVHVLSCVSGGSIVGAHYYLELRKLLAEKADRNLAEGDTSGADNADRPIGREDYIEIVERMQRDFLAGVQRNIRMRVIGNLFKCLRMAFSESYSRTVRAGELFESELYGRIQDGGDRERYISNLKVWPSGEGEHFNPKERNWLRRNKVPMLVLNATTLNTGHNWQFTASWMGEAPSAIDTEIDGNWRYRRMYYSEAPERYQAFRLGTAVGASACVPGLFEPVPLPELYPKEDTGYPEMTVRLVDGGVHDNQGIVSLLEQECTSLFVSDASGQMTSEAEPPGGVLGPVLRSSSISMERVRWAQFADLRWRYRTSLLKGLVVAHLKKGLVTDPVSWKTSTDLTSEPQRQQKEMLEYGVLRRVQESLANIRTDLDSFSDVEAYSLMASGYLMTGKYVEDLRDFPLDLGREHDWTFLKLTRYLQGRGDPKRQQEFEHLLMVGADRAFKVWRLSRWLGLIAGLFGLALVGLFVKAWVDDPGHILLKVDLNSLFWLILWTAAAAVLGKGVIAFLRFRKTLRQILVTIGIALSGWLVTRIHLVIFDPLFLRKGRLSRFTGDFEGKT